VTKDDGRRQRHHPGPYGSDFADQDFHSIVAIGRVQHDIGQSVSGLFTDREISGGANRVIGPDFQWRPKEGEVVTGQVLYSDTRTLYLGCPPGTCVPEEWDGRRMKSRAADFWYQHTDKQWDAFVEYRDFGDGFRADDGFVPQVGFREGFVEGGWSRHPTKGFVSRQRVFLQGDYVEDRPGALIQTFISPGTGIDGRANSFLRFWVIEERVRAFDTVTGEDSILPRRRFRTTLSASPWPWLTRVQLDGTYGLDVDFVRARHGHGGPVTFNATVRPTDHLAIDLLADRRWLDVPDGADIALVAARCVKRRTRSRAGSTPGSSLNGWRLAGSALYGFVRRTPPRRDPDSRRSPRCSPTSSTGNRSCSSGTATSRNGLLPGHQDLERSSRSFFLKLSYAFQR
jgi:hypothetical protein